MRSWIIAIAVLLVAGTWTAAAGVVQFAEGQRVFPKPGAHVIDGDETVDSDRFSVPWTIHAVEGERLLVGDDREGWVERSQVVLPEEAPTYYAQFINSKRYKSNRHKAWACYCRAAALQQAGDFERAIADYDEAIRLDPDRAAAYMARGGAREEQKDYDKAVLDYDEALRIDPKYPLATDRLARAHEARGRAWAEKNDFDRAIADFGEVIRLDPSSTTARNFRGWAWAKKKQYDKAIADFDEDLRVDPDDCAALNNAAWLRATCPEEHIRDGRAAVKMATKASGFSGGESYAWLDTLAAACAEAGDFDAAVEHQNRAIDLNLRDEEFVKEAQERLALYKDHKPYREE